ncbi:LuxR C-terminal-related transcriptional regulator [Streptomyces sp. BV129]|uniref:LuxR C-terminal-related transcriptional regulator n=1 Tax=unclassified Streptomyces TaxID=2593676 RepID=UPI001C2E4085|nr:helix-turn-helix transcriptional regulator [Streptomyces sp. BV129]MBV1949120.1 helix-turn-helix transcriptional regulator [Streptomyces sp. BV129]
MPVKIRTAHELTQLTPAEKRAAEHLVAGASNGEGAQALGISSTTFTGYIAGIGKKFGITSRRGRPARAHAVLASGQVPPPSAPDHIPDFTEQNLRLMRALAENAETHDIARAAGIAPADVRPMIADLVDKAGAANDTHLVGLGHAWGLLNTGSTQLAGPTRLPSVDQHVAGRSPRGATPTTAGSSTTALRR